MILSVSVMCSKQRSPSSELAIPRASVSCGQGCWLIRAGIQACSAPERSAGDGNANNRRWTYLFSLSKVCFLKISQKVIEKVFWSFFSQLLNLTRILTTFRRGMKAGVGGYFVLVVFYSHEDAIVPERKGNQTANAVWYWNKGHKKQPQQMRFGILTKLLYPIVFF